MEKTMPTPSKSGNTYTFVYLALRANIQKNTKPYVCNCSNCELSRYSRFMNYYENKENIQSNERILKKLQNKKILEKRETISIIL